MSGGFDPDPGISGRPLWRRARVTRHPLKRPGCGTAGHPATGPARTPDHFTADDRHPLWHELWDGDYHRMSSVMSEELREVMRALIADYDGSVARLGVLAILGRVRPWSGRARP